MGVKNKKIYINNKPAEIRDNSTYYDLIKDDNNKLLHPYIAVKVNNHFKYIYENIRDGDNIEFLNCLNDEANKIYVNGLIYILIYSCIKLYGAQIIINVHHSIDKGIYITLNHLLENRDIQMIANKMIETIKKDLKFQKIKVSRIDAIKYFELKGLHHKAEILKYSTNQEITLYKLDDMYDFYFNYMPPSTGTLKNFGLLKMGQDGLILTYSSKYSKDIVPEYKHHKKFFNLFEEQFNYMNIIGIHNAPELNKNIVNNKINDLIRLEETLFSNRLLSLANEIYQRKDKVKIVLLAGPSSSGKTTTSIKLSNYLKSFGIKTTHIAMDNYFLPIEKTPLDEDGNKDFDSLQALDIKLFDNNIQDLINLRLTTTPIYDFKKGESSLINKLQLLDGEILIIEGIHALNPKILTNIDSDIKYKVYIAPATDLNIDNHNRISTTDNRILRRIVRDARTRGYSPESTLAMWYAVRRGEEQNIYPYMEEADFMFNTSLLYELNVLHTYALPLLYSVEYESIYYDEAKRLINLLKNFLPIPSDEIPRDSIIREFIGGSCYNVD